MLLFVSAVQQSPPIAQAIREGERGLRPVGALARSWLTNLVLLRVSLLTRACSRIVRLTLVYLSYST